MKYVEAEAAKQRRLSRPKLSISLWNSAKPPTSSISLCEIAIHPLFLLLPFGTVATFLPVWR